MEVLRVRRQAVVLVPAGHSLAPGDQSGPAERLPFPTPHCRAGLRAQISVTSTAGGCEVVVPALWHLHTLLWTERTF
jgi:hypothetical protein